MPRCRVNRPEPLDAYTCFERFRGPPWQHAPLPLTLLVGLLLSRTDGIRCRKPQTASCKHAYLCNAKLACTTFGRAHQAKTSILFVYPSPTLISLEVPTCKINKALSLLYNWPAVTFRFCNICSKFPLHNNPLL